MQRVAFNEIEAWNKRKNRKPLILMGARQVGKTWLMDEFARSVYSGDSVSVNFMEDDAIRENFETVKLDPKTLVSLIQARSGRRIVPGKTLLVLDEIQESPRALTSLKFFNEKMPELAIIAAGSLLGLSLRRKHGTKERESKGSFPVGKVDFIDVRPMTFSEYLLARGESVKSDELATGNWEILNLIHDEMVRHLKDYLFVGGMPDAVRTFVANGDYLETRRTQKSILKAYDKDFVKHAEPSLLPRIRLLWNNVSAQLGKPNKKFIYKAMKEGARGRSYEDALQWLDDAGMVHQVFRADPPRMPLKSYEDFSAFKLYMHDVGLLGAMSGLPASALLELNSIFTNFKGALTEQYVLQELLAAGVSPSYWAAERGDAEVDFIVQGSKAVFPVEVKAERNLKAKSLKTYREFFKPPVCYRTSLSEYAAGRLTRDIPLYAVARIAEEVRK
ncbi:MAG: ATP-binding protein [Kiritimatiellae bacterium]|nr:ATP-binding protein [Kiritimatiellia bacterium]